LSTYLIVNNRLTSLSGTITILDLAVGLLSLEGKFRREPLRKLFLLACLIVLLVPFGASAHPKKHHIRANEMAGMGLGAAALVGVAGYLLLRRRHSA
jgi:MYXO-CTERM domain-containing protein